MLEPILPDNLGLYYGNAWHAPQSGRTDPTFDPATGKVLAQVATGPGTPILDDAPQRLRQILAQLDAGQPLGVGDDHFAILFELCRPEDSLSIWHLMMHAEGAQRFVYAKLLDRLVPTPASVAAQALTRTPTPAPTLPLTRRGDLSPRAAPRAACRMGG